MEPFEYRHQKPPRFHGIKSWYARWERPLSSISLFGGFAFDAITLKRVDMFWENFWVIVHLAIVGICIILINVRENKGANPKEPVGFHFWLVNILQFFFGGLLSTFLVFYFRSGTIAASWPFFIILAAAFIANESFKNHFMRLTFQVSLFFLSLYAFAIYIVPVLLHSINAFIFILSGVASLIVLWLFLLILRLVAREKFTKSRIPLALSIITLVAGINVLYFYNLIPPIPLSLKDSGIYHSLTVNAPGRYTVTSDDQGPFGFFKLADDVHLAPGAPLYAYSAIFSPDSFSTTIIHEWQEYDPVTKAWVTKGRVNLPVMGGRDGGFRTFSMEENIEAGKWRVNVLTTRGAVIGRISFNVIPASGNESPLITTEID